MKKFIILLTALMLTSAITAQEVREQILNTSRDGAQRDAHIATNGDSIWAVVYTSEHFGEKDIRLKLKTDSRDIEIIGERGLFPLENRPYEKPKVAIDKEGNVHIVAAFKSDSDTSIYDVMHHMIMAPPVTGYTEAVINEHKLNSQTNPDVAVHPDGNYAVVWDSWFQDGSKRGVYGAYYNGTGQIDKFQINTTTENSQARPKVKFFPNGSFIVIWESWLQEVATPGGYGLFGKIYDPERNVLVDEFQINTYTNDYQWFGDIVTLDDGSFIIAWCSWEQDGDDGGIYMQKFDADANRIGNEVLVNKTTVNYQWLPKIDEDPDGNIIVVWSAWKQDGSREGVYGRLFNSALEPISLETRLNDYTENYQWEPDFITTGVNEIYAVWSSYGIDDNDYEVVGRYASMLIPEALIDDKTYEHDAGRTTTTFTVHVVDSTALTGDTYKLRFNIINEDSVYGHITNETSGTDIAYIIPMMQGEGVNYQSQEIDGFVVEINPVLELNLDVEGSYFANHSGSNVMFEYGESQGLNEVAPIDAAIIWGDPAKDNDGNYIAPLDSAYNTTGQKVVYTPFKVWNMTDGEPLDMVIFEPSQTENLRWDAGEEFQIITPQQYATAFPRYHAVINSSYEGGLMLPQPGDTNYVFTRRPVTGEDEFLFSTLDANIITGIEDENPFLPNSFELSQNYPNPFNPTTTISYTIPKEGLVRLSVYNILGQRVAVLKDEIQRQGSYRVLFNGAGLASGVYIYNLVYGSMNISKKMMLIK